MRSLCTCAALAVAAAFAQQHFAEAVLQSEAINFRDESETHVGTITRVDDNQDCTAEFNAFRNKLIPGSDSGDRKYTPFNDGQPETKLNKLEEALTCADARDGKFEHYDREQQIFKFSAVKKGEAASPMTRETYITCQEALDALTTEGFAAFGKNPPSEFKERDDLLRQAGLLQKRDAQADVYKNANAVGLFSLLQAKGHKVLCGHFRQCAKKDFLFCYLDAEEEVKNVDYQYWQALEADNGLKPKLKKPEQAEDLGVVNELRTAVGLNEQPFTYLKSPDKKTMRRVMRSDLDGDDNKDLKEAIQKYLYHLSCDDFNDESKIKQTITVESKSKTGEKVFTVIHYIRDNNTTAPTLEEAVKHWKDAGLAKLNYRIPPVYKKGSGDSADSEDQTRSDGASESQDEASEIYKNSAVYGFVSIMTANARRMACLEMTGCKSEKAGLICLLDGETLKSGQQPISAKVWKEIMKKEGHTLPEFKLLEADKNCIAEMNAVRTQEKLGLKPFLEPEAKTTSEATQSYSNVMQSLTCENMAKQSAATYSNATGPQIIIADNKTSLMYHSGAEGTCSEAVAAFKKGFEKFDSAPPAFSANSALYKDPAATNFVSLISEKESTKATCYSTDCEKPTIVCELDPAVLSENQKPVSEAIFTKYSDMMKGEGTSSANAVSSQVAVIGSVLMALVAGVFFF